MSDTSIRILALCRALWWLAAGVLAAFRHVRAAAGLNSGLALLFLAFAAPRLLRWLADPNGYVQRYGAAALADLRSAGAIVALSGVALVFGGFAFAQYRRLFWVAWIANVPTIALVVYLGFWFRMF